MMSDAGRQVKNDGEAMLVNQLPRPITEIFTTLSFSSDFAVTLIEFGNSSGYD